MPTSSTEPQIARARLAAKLGKAVAVVIAVLCLAYFAREVWRRWPELTSVAWSSKVALAFAVATFGQAASVLLDAWSWGWILRALGVPAETRAAVSVFGISQFAKYLPGNVGQHVGRLDLSRRQGWQLGRVGVSMLLENGFAIAAGALFGAFGAVLLAAGSIDQRTIVLAALFAFGAVAGTAAILLVLARPPLVVRRLLRLSEPLRVPLSVVAGYFAVHLLSYVAMGFAVIVILAGLDAASLAWAWRVPLVVAAGWLAGYLTPGAPAGLGVREVVVTTLLTPHTGATIAVSASLLWRLSALFTDVVILGAAFALRRPVRENALDAR